MSSKYLTKEKIFHKLQRYCIYQDRCHQEVRTKLITLEVYGTELEEIIATLIKDKYLDEERFAKSYARGKFNIKKWGIIKISNELVNRDVSEYCIKKGLQEINDDDYLNTLQSLISEQFEKNNGLSQSEKKHKCYLFCVRKGYEEDLVLKNLPK